MWCVISKNPAKAEFTKGHIDNHYGGIRKTTKEKLKRNFSLETEKIGSVAILEKEIPVLVTTLQTGAEWKDQCYIAQNDKLCNVSDHFKVATIKLLNLLRYCCLHNCVHLSYMHRLKQEETALFCKCWVHVYNGIKIFLCNKLPYSKSYFQPIQWSPWACKKRGACGIANGRELKNSIMPIDCWEKSNRVINPAPG